MLSSIQKKLTILLLLISVGCASATVSQKQNQTLQVLQRLDEFQNLVIDLYGTGDVSQEHAIQYVRFTVAATKAIKNYPDGYAPLVKESWNQLKNLIPFDKMEYKVQAVAKLLDILVGSL
jgi:hypothetical protein